MESLSQQTVDLLIARLEELQKDVDFSEVEKVIDQLKRIQGELDVITTKVGVIQRSISSKICTLLTEREVTVSLPAAGNTTLVERILDQPEQPKEPEVIEEGHIEIDLGNDDSKYFDWSKA